jgi:dTDP-glucose 4,6-dehydratase
MNLLVTGGAGFIGSQLVRGLLTREAGELRNGLALRSLVVLDSLTYAGRAANLDEVRDQPLFHFVQGDIADREAVARVFREHAITDVIHLAAESHVDRSIDDPGPFIRTNVEGTYCLLEAARRAWPRGAGHRFLQVSTDEVFGSLEEKAAAFSEMTPYAPGSPYSASKAAGDHLARAYHRTYGLPVLISNCSNNYGPRQFPEKLIPLMILQALEGKPLPVYGDGGQIRDWLHVEDHTRGLLAVLQRGVPGESYLFGGEGRITNLELVRLLCRALQDRCPRPAGDYEELITFVADRPGHDRRYAINAGKARRELGWSPEISLADGLGRTVDWYLANRDWCEAITRDIYRRERLGHL